MYQFTSLSYSDTIIQKSYRKNKTYTMSPKKLTPTVVWYTVNFYVVQN